MQKHLIIEPIAVFIYYYIEKELLMQDKPELQSNVPVSLIKTWVWMVTESADPAVIDQGTDKLLEEFESLRDAQSFIEKYE
jgi:hypothetical protein